MVKFIRVYKEDGSLCTHDITVSGDAIEDLPTLKQYAILNRMYCFADYDKCGDDVPQNPIPSVILPSLPTIVHILNSSWPEESDRLIVSWGLYAQAHEVTAAHPHLGGVVTVPSARRSLEDLFEMGKVHRRRVTAGATKRYAVGERPKASTVVRPLWRLTENYRRHLDAMISEMI